MPQSFGNFVFLTDQESVLNIRITSIEKRSDFTEIPRGYFLVRKELCQKIKVVTPFEIEGMLESNWAPSTEKPDGARRFRFRFDGLTHIAPISCLRLDMMTNGDYNGGASLFTKALMNRQILSLMIRSHFHRHADKF